MKLDSSFIGKAAYAIFFVILIPWLLLQWDKALKGVINLAVPGSVTHGWIFFSAGFLLLFLAMVYLIILGKGLPMNAYPPSQFVQQGPYSLVRHPIYIGFALMLIGYFMGTGSSPGFWLITPLSILGMTALVLGYEAIDLKERFPDQRLSALIDVPSSDHSKPEIKHRVGSLILILGMLLPTNILIDHISRASVGISYGGSGFMEPLPELNWAWAAIVFILLSVILQNSVEGLRQWTIKALIIIGSLLFLTIFFPGVLAESLLDSTLFYMTVPLSLLMISLTNSWKGPGWKRIILLIVFVLAVYSQLRLSWSPGIYFISGLVLYVLADFYRGIWAVLRRFSQWIANSWKEWTFGRIRVINHGFYVGFGTFGGILLCGVLVGDAYAWGILIFAIIVIVFSALWAQVIEGSEKLKRPYGYYGALVGIIFASAVVYAMGYNVWLIIAIISVAMPWVQAVGRLRCLINGCCHGSTTANEWIGIRYFHHRSRVCGLSDLKGQLLHPTQLYAILWLFLIGFIMLKFWFDRYGPSFIFGMYLILTGLGRFVEEAYRGEVQTKIIRGLRLYQWTAIVSVVIGIIMTTVNISFEYVITDFGIQTFWAALLGALFTFFAMGVDFPNSNARFSRLV